VIYETSLYCRYRKWYQKILYINIYKHLIGIRDVVPTKMVWECTQNLTILKQL